MTSPLAPLAAVRQFIAVRFEPLPEGRTNKLPLDPSGRVADAHNPANWMSWAEAHALATRLGAGHGIGFVLTAGCGFVCLDLDGCIGPDGQYTQIVHDIAAQLGPHVAWELSQSRRGLHLWMRGTLGAHAKKNTAVHAELYSELRFIALGTPFAGDMDAPCPGLAAVAARYFPLDQAAGAVPEEGPVPEWRGPADDDDLIRRAMRSTSKTGLFGGTGTVVNFSDLWTANADALRARWPDPNGIYDQSSADAALAAHLAFWTGKDVARIERLMRRSALVRDKWDDRSDYLVARTITGACARCTEVLSDPVPLALQADQPPPGGASDGVRHAEEVVYMPEAVLSSTPGDCFVSREDVLRLFAGHCYVLDQHKILTSKGMLVKPEQFRAMHGGSRFYLSDQKSTANAWEAFTENQEIIFPRAESTCFRPRHPFGAIVVEDGLRRVNTYLPPNVRAVPGDAGPFLTHLKKLLPDGDDATILLSYMAACVQYPGRKFPWAPVLQGVEGNGKTLFSIVTAYAVGKRYVHWPAATKLDAKFNAWMVGKILYCVEDIHLPGLRGEQILEGLKPMITGGRGLEIEGKNEAQVTADIVGNFLINTNHKDGIRKSSNDRRYCIFYSAQQQAADLARDFGNVEAYMRGLYDWLDHGDGLAICAHLLQTYAIPEQYDPTRGAQRAPRSSSHDAALKEGRGYAEDVVQEAIDEERVGFKGGWVSSAWLKRLVESDSGIRGMSPKRRRAVMGNLGYVPHPALKDGRAPNKIELPDAERSILFVQPGSMQAALTTPTEIVAAYVKAQS
ncbi:MAG: hypothetical protein KGJ38_08300 [Burkholderiaceae bacterium]|nr:hypothetical protein [Burkholderiaceae bacterium]